MTVSRYLEYLSPEKCKRCADPRSFGFRFCIAKVSDIGYPVIALSFKKSIVNSRRRKIHRLSLQVLDLLKRPFSFRALVRIYTSFTFKAVKYVLYFPTVVSRKILQYFIGSVGSTRYLMHIFIVIMSLVISVGGFARKGAVGNSIAPENQYVVAFGSQIESTRYVSMLDNGYLTKANTAVTNITTGNVTGVQEYIVQPGDTLSVIASRFNVSTKTLEWANQLTNINNLKPGQKLTILPTSGVLVQVGEDGSLAGIAQKYDISEEEIISYNDLVTPVRLVRGQQLVVPIADSAIPDMPKPEPVVAAVSSVSGAGGSAAVSTANVGSVVGSGQFGWPTSGRITKTCAQHGWRDCAIDIASRALPPVYAADAGVVVVAGWPDNYGYGNRVDIDHGNGFVTRYAHLSVVNVSPGQRVSKGQLIGKMGCTGWCSGPHVHFMIIQNGAPRDPMIYL